MRNARIKLYMQNRQFGQDRVVTYGAATTDDDGKYEFTELIPADYFVSAAARPWYAVYPGWVDENGVRTRIDTVAPELNVAYATTYFNGATEAEGATPISVEKGGRVNADIHFNPLPALHVTVKVQGNPADGTAVWPNAGRASSRSVAKRMSGSLSMCLPQLNPARRRCQSYLRITSERRLLCRCG